MRQSKNVWWLYQARRVNTQTNGAGGALKTRISMNAGQVGILVQGKIIGTASAGATLIGTIDDEDTADNSFIVNIAAGASRAGYIPSVGTAANAHNNLTESNNLKIGPGQYISFGSSAGLLNETLTVGIVLLLSTPDLPTWDTTGSAGTPSLAASTISAANTLQPVLI